MTPAARLRPVRTGRWADPVQSVVLVAGLAAGFVHPVATVAVAVPLGVVAPSVRRAFVLGVYLSAAVAAAWWIGWYYDTPAAVRAETGWPLDPDLALWLAAGAAATVLVAVIVNAVLARIE